MTTAPVTTLTDELIAEIEAAAKGTCQYSDGDWFDVDNFAMSFEQDDAEYLALAKPSTILALIARLREDERKSEMDAKRLDWLVSERATIEFLQWSPKSCVYWIFWPHTVKEQGHAYGSIRDAIDAAMPGAHPSFQD